MGRIISDEEFNRLPGTPTKVITDEDFKKIIDNSKGKATTGIWDALKKGFGNIKESISNSGQELSDTLDSNAPKPIKFAKTATTLTKGIIRPLAEAAIMTPARVAGEVAQNVSGVDVNEEISQGTLKLMQKGMDTRTARKAMEGWAKLKETDPESATALSTVLDIGEIASYAIGGAGVKSLAGGATKQIERGASAVGDMAGTAGRKIKFLAPKAEKAGEYAASQTFGFNPETVRQILKNPGKFTPTQMAQTNRESLFNKVKTAVDKRLEDLSETGKAYQPIRESGAKVTFKEDIGNKVLSKFGLKLDENGKLIITSESIPLGAGDVSGIENFIKLYGNKELTANGILNARKALDNLSGWASDKTSAAKTIARELRHEIDTVAKESIPGLKALDAKFGSEKQLLNKVKSAIYNADGTIKDNAVQKIATLTGKGKELAIKRMEKIVPGLREELNILKAIEDVQAAGGQKVGTYMRALGGVGAGAAFGGPVGAILGLIATSPSSGVAILRAFAKYRKLPAEQVSSIIGKMKAGKKLMGEELKIMNEAVDNATKKSFDKIKKIRPGMSIQDVSKKSPLLQDAVAKGMSKEEWIKGQTPNYTTVYHRTNSQVDNFGKGGIFSKENRNEFFVSNKKVGQAEGYGKNVIELRVKKSDLSINDEFPSGEKHYTLDTSKVDEYLKTKSQLSAQYDEAVKGKPLYNKAQGGVKAQREAKQLAEGQKMVDSGPSAQFEKAVKNAIEKAKKYSNFEAFRNAYPNKKESILKKIFIQSRK